MRVCLEAARGRQGRVGSVALQGPRAEWGGCGGVAINWVVELAVVSLSVGLGGRLVARVIVCIARLMGRGVVRIRPP